MSGCSSGLCSSSSSPSSSSSRSSDSSGAAAADRSRSPVAGSGRAVPPTMHLQGPGFEFRLQQTKSGAGMKESPGRSQHYSLLHWMLPRTTFM